MSKIDYTPVQFVREWLPDYEIGLNRYKKETGMKYMLARVLEISEAQEYHFCLDNFLEALENFAKAQREECLKNFLTGDIPLKSAILNAPMPEPIKPQQP